jgi:hypothetical protein
MWLFRKTFDINLKLKLSIMDLVTYSKTEYLLDESLDALHGTSLTWIGELQFSKDEMIFLYRTLNQRKRDREFPSEEITVIEKELIDLSSDGIYKLLNRLKNHNQEFAHLTHATGCQNENAFRENHHKLYDEVYRVYDLIKSFRKKVFSYLEIDIPE